MPQGAARDSAADCGPPPPPAARPLRGAPLARGPPEARAGMQRGYACARVQWFSENTRPLLQVVRADIDVEALRARDEARRQQQQQQQQDEKQHNQRQHGAGGEQQAAPGSGGGAVRHHHPLSAAGGPQLRAGEALAAAPDWAVPSGAWVRAFVEDFQRLRLRVADAYESGGAGGGWGAPVAPCVLPSCALIWGESKKSNAGGKQEEQCGGESKKSKVQAPASAVAPPIADTRMRQTPGCRRALRFRPDPRPSPDALPHQTPELAGSSPLPGPNDHQAWDRLCFGRGVPGEQDASADADASDPGAGDSSNSGGPVPGSEITFLSPSILPTLMALEPVGLCSAFPAAHCSLVKHGCVAVGKAPPATGPSPA